MRSIVAGLLILLCGAPGLLAAGKGVPAVIESAREIPVAYRVDVVVVGGSTGGVAAALAAARNGAKVFLLAPRPYLGEDMAGTLRVWLEEKEKPGAPLAAKLFEAGSPARPLHVKKTLDDALIETDVDYLYSCYATDVLRDDAGNLCGVVMANRAGRQAVVAKVIIDATDRAWVARMAGAKFAPYPAGEQVFRRVVIGGDVQKGENVEGRKVGLSFAVKDKAYDVIEYTLQMNVKDGGFASLAEAEQLARDRTFHPDQQFASDVLFHVPPDPMKGEKSISGRWRGAGRLDVAAFRPAGVQRLFVIGGCADLPREQAARLLRPPALIAMGTRIGEAAAEEAGKLPDPKGVKVVGTAAQAVAGGDVREALVGVRPTQKLATIPSEKRVLPVLGEYDVVVIGGGTSGAPAGIAAARQGAKTLVLEYLYGLGGVGTQGAISKYYFGFRGGFTGTVAGGGAWQIEQKAEWWRKTLREAGAELWMGVLGCGAFVDGGRVAGVVVATPQGRGVVLAKTVVDATGNADIAAAAGASTQYVDETDIAVQGTGLPPRELGTSYTNTDFTQTDETDVVDVSNLLVYAKSMYRKDTFDMGQLVDTRERRRIEGDFTIGIYDQMINRTYPDTIAQASTNFDTHGYTIDPFFAVQHPDKKITFRTYVPYRALLPKSLDGILVTGLGVSAHRDAIPLIRMQPDLQNQGYAAGAAAAMTARKGGSTRSIDIRTLQKHLVEIGNLPETVLTDQDSYPLPDEAVAAAVERVRDLENEKRYEAVAIVMAHPEKSLPLLREAYAKASTDPDKQTYAQALGMMGDPTGVPALIAAVEGFAEWDKGWNFRGMGQFGPNLSPLDTLIYALGHARDRRGTSAIVAKVKQLDAGKDFSHHRAVALALELLADPAAVEPLAQLLSKPEMSGHAIQSVEQARQWHQADPEGLNALQPRRQSLREIMLARAMYRCGDKDGMGKKTLTEYTKDLRGHFARHAKAVLEAGGK